MNNVVFLPSGLKCETPGGVSSLDLSNLLGVGIRSLCGGNGLCHQCWVRPAVGKHSKHKIDCLAENMGPLSKIEEALITENPEYEGMRLACQTAIAGDVVIDVPDNSQEHRPYVKKDVLKQTFTVVPSVVAYEITLADATLEENPANDENLLKQLALQGVEARLPRILLPQLDALLNESSHLRVLVRDGCEVVTLGIAGQRSLLGAAIDIGSTTIALYLFDLERGELLFNSGAMNPQIRFGEDLMSRVSYIMMNKGGDKELSSALHRQLISMLSDAIGQLNVEGELVEVVLVGNPIMHHLFWELSPVRLGQAPFTLTTRQLVSATSGEMGFALSSYVRFSFLPLIAGHVGADALACCLSQIHRMQSGVTLLVDIGTNAEILLAKDGVIYATSSPTGPALEGAEISAGVRAGVGAVERVRIDPETLETRFQVIGHQDWFRGGEASEQTPRVIGLCGSGIIEAIVSMATAGLIDAGGLFVEQRAPGRFVRKNNINHFLLLEVNGDKIYISQTDVRSIQLAKAALWAGVCILMDYIGCEVVDTVLLCGAFGAHLDPHYVDFLDIIPRADKEKIETIGNAAGVGASMVLLNRHNREQVVALAKKINKIESASEPTFQEYFVAGMRFSRAPAQKLRKQKRRNRGVPS